MQKITDNNSGVYILELFADNSFTIDSKRHKGIIFKDGYYYYAGSSQKNFNSRIKRHITKSKIINWHIDYLTTSTNNNPKTILKRVYIFPDKPKEFECKLSSDLEKKFNCSTEIIGFGNGDCKKCSTHLFYRKKRISQIHFISLYHATVFEIPSSSEYF